MTINNEHIRSLSGVSDEFLVECAKKAMENSYSIYSGFRVGAALMADNNMRRKNSNSEGCIRR